MANGKWQMANGKWQMAKWQMANGKWQMANGKWQNGKMEKWQMKFKLMFRSVTHSPYQLCNQSLMQNSNETNTKTKLLL
jgi:hypothetical protein